MLPKGNQKRNSQTVSPLWLTGFDGLVLELLVSNLSRGTLRDMHVSGSILSTPSEVSLFGHHLRSALGAARVLALCIGVLAHKQVNIKPLNVQRVKSCKS